MGGGAFCHLSEKNFQVGDTPAAPIPIAERSLGELADRLGTIETATSRAMKYDQ
jgi:hypothetical protein